MSLCLQEFTYSTAFPAPPKDPMGLSEEENALVFRFEPKQQNEARPYHFSNQNFEANEFNSLKCYIHCQKLVKPNI